MRDAAQACRVASLVLDELAFELLVRGQGPLSRDVRRIIGDLDSLRGALSRSARRIAVLGRFRTVVENVNIVYVNLQMAADTPIDAETIGDNPRAALDGYTSYFRAAAGA